MTWLPPGQASKDNSGNGPSGCCDVPQTGRVLPLDTVVTGQGYRVSKLLTPGLRCIIIMTSRNAFTVKIL